MSPVTKCAASSGPLNSEEYAEPNHCSKMTMAISATKTLNGPTTPRILAPARLGTLPSLRQTLLCDAAVGLIGAGTLVTGEPLCISGTTHSCQKLTVSILIVKLQ